MGAAGPTGAGDVPIVSAFSASNDVDTAARPLSVALPGVVALPFCVWISVNDFIYLDRFSSFGVGRVMGS